MKNFSCSKKKISEISEISEFLPMDAIDPVRTSVAVPTT